ncbi:MAG: DUF2840 domain-containing protein [Rhodospirillales bacterium]|nr:DUF2840 domain-containing protein [Rhodospirillales bacterium]
MTSAHPSSREPHAHAATPNDDLTHAQLTWVEKKIEHWIRFGKVAQEQILDRRRRVVSFVPGTVFAFVRWASNDYGTILSRIDIVRAVDNGQACQTLPFVRPGGDILLKVESWPKVEQVLQIIDAIEGLSINPSDVDPDHWRHVHHRIAAGVEPRPYSMMQHRAVLLRRRAAS